MTFARLASVKRGDTDKPKKTIHQTLTSFHSWSTLSYASSQTHQNCKATFASHQQSCADPIDRSSRDASSWKTLVGKMLRIWVACSMTCLRLERGETYDNELTVCNWCFLLELFGKRKGFVANRKRWCRWALNVQPICCQRFLFSFRETNEQYTDS